MEEQTPRSNIRQSQKKKSNLPQESGRCQVFVTAGGHDIDNWVTLIKNFLSIQGNLTKNISDSDVVMVIAGQSFERMPDQKTSLLIEKSLKESKQVIPVFVNGAHMPKKLPASIQDFAHLQFITIAEEHKIPGIIARVIASYQNKGSRFSQQTLISSVLTRLSEKDWTVKSKSYDLNQYFALYHSTYRLFRFEVRVKESAIALQEHIRSAKRLGLRQWETKSVFPISMPAPGTESLLQLPKNLIAAASNPFEYLYMHTPSVDKPLKIFSQEIPKVSIFVCYRRDDSGVWAGTLVRALASKVGGSYVFFDVGSQKPGSDYREQINKALSKCTHFVIMIGQGFLEPDTKGKRRIDKPNDQVWKEIKSALDKRKIIQVVLIGDTKLPKPNDLPVDLRDITKVKNVYQLKSEAGAESIAEKIIKERTQFFSGRDNPFISQKREFKKRKTVPLKPVAETNTVTETTREKPVWLSKDNSLSNVLNKWNKEKQEVRKYIEWVVAKLSTHGWCVISKQYDDNQNRTYLLGHVKYPQFRFEVQSEYVDIVLQEHIQSVKKLGLFKWVTRSFFSISPNTFQTVDLLQLPDNLLEAALNPEKWLDRTGRVVIKNRIRKKLMGHYQLRKTIKAEKSENPSAIENYQQMLRQAKSRGGLSRLTLVQEFNFPGNFTAKGAIFTPDGSRLAVVSNKGLNFINTHNWQADRFLIPGSLCRSLDFSPQGWLAIGSEKGGVWIWKPDGSRIKAANTPYSLVRRTMAPWSDTEIAFSTVSWSDNGKWIACCNMETVWIFHIETQQFFHCLTFPKPTFSLTEHGALFIPGSDNLLIYGSFRRIWVVQLPKMEVINSLELKQNKIQFRFHSDQSSDQTSNQPPVIAFTQINTAEPSPDGKLVACAGSHGQVAIYNMKTMLPVNTFVWHEPFWNGMSSNVKASSFSPDGKWIATLGHEGDIVVGSTINWKPEYKSRIDSIVIGNANIAWAADSTMMAVNTESKIGIWRM